MQDFGVTPMEPVTVWGNVGETPRPAKVWQLLNKITLTVQTITRETTPTLPLLTTPSS